MDLGSWYAETADEIGSRLHGGPALGAALAAADLAVHLAVLVEPFLGFVLDGSKRVESRFSAVRMPPFRAVDEGDVILLKAASGPVVAVTLASEVWCYGGLTAKARADLHERFGADLRDDVPGFWEHREAARFATLIRLGEVACLATPIPCPKTDRRGWVVLRERPNQLSLFG